MDLLVHTLRRDADGGVHISLPRQWVHFSQHAPRLCAAPARSASAATTQQRAPLCHPS
jgi:hypothetical protein